MPIYQHVVGQFAVMMDVGNVAWFAQIPNTAAPGKIAVCNLIDLRNKIVHVLFNCLNALIMLWLNRSTVQHVTRRSYHWFCHPIYGQHLIHQLLWPNVLD